jgi:hypothetical protein
MLPRFAKADMPPKPEPEGTQPAAGAARTAGASAQPAAPANGSKQTPDASGQPAGKGAAHRN